MNLASIEGNIAFLVLAAIVGIINWIAKKNEVPPDPTPRKPRTTRSGESEEERLRRFMEALGVPSDQPPPKPVERRPVQPVPMPKIQPRGPLVAGRDHPMGRSAGERKVAVSPMPPPMPVRTRTAPPVPAVAVERKEVVDVPVAMPSIIDTVSSHVTAIPFEASHAQMRDAYNTVPEVNKDRALEGVRELLGSPADLRRAFILKEILGAPRSLQSAGSLPNFP